MHSAPTDNAFLTLFCEDGRMTSKRVYMSLGIPNRFERMYEDKSEQCDNGETAAWDPRTSG